MAIQAREKHILQRWNFRVLIDGFDEDIKFTKVGPLEPELSVAKLREGGSYIEKKDAGFITFPPLTLEKGSKIGEDQMYDWFNTTADAISNSGALREDYIKNMTVEQLNRDGSVAKRYRFFGCFPSKPRFFDLDASSEDFEIESVEIEYEKMEKI